MHAPLLIPPNLRKAHFRNEQFVDSLNGSSSPNGEQRIFTLVKLYRTLSTY
ncbi:hypothetical protein [Lacticaseibacillus paracasei]|uniref:hypothetical protein n=1 Tax=Lacticaseibacillus paracasei TaxID=1597 RepID=UPI0033405FDC